MSKASEKKAEKAEEAEQADEEEFGAPSDTAVQGFIAEDVKAAHKAAKDEAKEAGVSPGAVMFSAPEGYGTGVEPVIMGDGSASHGDFSDFAKAEEKRVAALAKADKA